MVVGQKFRMRMDFNPKYKSTFIQDFRRLDGMNLYVKVIDITKDGIIRVEEEDIYSGIIAIRKTDEGYVYAYGSKDISIAIESNIKRIVREAKKRKGEKNEV